MVRAYGLGACQCFSLQGILYNEDSAAFPKLLAASWGSLTNKDHAVMGATRQQQLPLWSQHPHIYDLGPTYKWKFPYIGRPSHKPQHTILIMGNPKRVPLILGSPQVWEPLGAQTNYISAWVLPPLSNSWLLIIVWLYIALNRTPNIDCYWVGAVPKSQH